MSVQDGLYVPLPNEKYCYDFLWANASPNGEDLSGKAAVTFFQRSGVDIGILKQIWTLSTPVASMNMAQFFTALRYITMMQNGEIPLSKAVALGLPRFNGIDVPKPVAAAPPAPAPQVNPNAYAITPVDHVKYHQLFETYDTNKDSFLSYEECFDVFRRSNMDPATLQRIWTMADDDKDNRLTSKEFCVAFHLIICISKKGLPVPPAIPPMLKGFLVNAPAVPGGVAPAAPVVPVPIATPPPVVAALVPVAQPEFKAASVSDAFGSLDEADKPLPGLGTSNNNITPAPTAVVSSFGVASSTVTVTAPVPPVAPQQHQAPVQPSAFAPSPVNTQQQHNPVFATYPAPVATAPVTTNNNSFTQNDDVELSQGIDAIKQVARKSLAAHETALDSNSKSFSALQSIKQRLAVDRISMEAALNNATAAGQESTSKLDTIVNEINALQEQLKELRNRTENVNRNNTSIQEQTTKALLEKQRLQQLIQDTLKQTNSIHQDIAIKSQEAGAALGELNALQDSIETTAQQYRQQIAQKETENDSLQTEIRTLKEILNQLSSDRDRYAHSLQNINNSISNVKTQIKNEQSTLNGIKSSNDKVIHNLNYNQQSLQSEKTQLLSTIQQTFSEHASNLTISTTASNTNANSPATSSVTFKQPTTVASTSGAIHNNYGLSTKSNLDAFADLDVDTPTSQTNAGGGDFGFGGLGVDFSGNNSIKTPGTTIGLASPVSTPSYSQPTTVNSAAAAPVVSANNTTTATTGEDDWVKIQPSTTTAGAGAAKNEDAFSNFDSFNDDSTNNKNAKSDSGFDAFGAIETTNNTAVSGNDDAFAVKSSSSNSNVFDDAFSEKTVTATSAPISTTVKEHTGSFDAFGSSNTAAVSTNDTFDAFGSSSAATTNQTVPASAQVNNSNNTFDAFGSVSGTNNNSNADSNFDAFGDASGNNNDNASASSNNAFDAFGGSSTSANNNDNSAFDSFGTVSPPSVATPVVSGFDAFNNTTASSNNDAFDAFGSAGTDNNSNSTGFDAFGSAASINTRPQSGSFDAFGGNSGNTTVPAADFGNFDAFGGSSAVISDNNAFDAFGGNSGNNDGFDAFGGEKDSNSVSIANDPFGSSNNSNTHDVDPFASFE